MLTNQQSYTVSDEFEREILTPHLPNESPVKSYEQPPGDPCHTLLDWEDSLEDRPVVFKIRDYSNCEENSATVSVSISVIMLFVRSSTQQKFVLQISPLIDPGL